MHAPIVIFAFNRPDSLQRLIESLSASPIFKISEKYIFIDGPRTHSDKIMVSRTANIARTVTPNVVESVHNKGLANSIIKGVNTVLERHEKVIVLEDDLWCAPGFLNYMNQGLERYETDDKICSICGYGLKISKPADYNGDVYLSNRSSSWGWGIWRNRWEKVDWVVEDFQEFIKNKKLRYSFNRGGSDMTSMLCGYMDGLNRSWAIRFCYWQWKNGMYSIHPFMSLVDNEGYGTAATNCCQKYSRFKTDMELKETEVWDMPANLNKDERILKRIRRYHSVPLRIYSRLRRMLNI